MHLCPLKFCQNRYFAVITVDTVYSRCVITSLRFIKYIQNKNAYLFIIHNLLVLISYKCTYTLYAITYLIYAGVDS